MTRIGSWNLFICGITPGRFRYITPWRANFKLHVLKEVQDYHQPQGSHQGGGEMRAILRSVCEDVMDNFVRRVKKCTGLNGHIEHALKSTQEQAYHHRVLAIYS